MITAAEALSITNKSKRHNSRISDDLIMEINIMILNQTKLGLSFLVMHVSEYGEKYPLRDLLKLLKDLGYTVRLEEDSMLIQWSK